MDIAISHFSGTSREPRFLPSPNEINALVPLYEVIDQTGLEIQYLLDNLAIKGEVISRSGNGDRYTAATYGFELTQVGFLQTRMDLGWVVEFNHDDRLESSLLFLGLGLVLMISTIPKFFPDSLSMISQKSWDFSL